MNNKNKALFVFGFLFYFIGDLATTYIGVSNGIQEKSLISMLGSLDFADMIFIKILFFIVLYFLIIFLELRGDNYLCGAILGLVAGMGMAVTWINALTILEHPG